MLVSPILNLIVRVITPCIQLFGIYVIANGHLAPGGAFAGGTIVASSFVLKALVRCDPVEEDMASLLESSSLGLYLGAGLIGLLAGQSFLANKGVFPLGVPGTQFSGGMILVVALAIGAKVGSTMQSLYRELVLGTIHDEEGEGDGHAQ